MLTNTKVKNYVLCAIKTCFAKSASDVVDHSKMESWSNMTLKVTLKASFNIMCLRSIL